MRPNTGAAPTSGLNFSGQRARSNLVNVDGADATDNSVNGVRSTVSQEAVQEFQIITNGYAAEYGRASGGVVNIITRSGVERLPWRRIRVLAQPQFPGREPVQHGEESGIHAGAGRSRVRRADQEGQDVTTTSLMKLRAGTRPGFRASGRTSSGWSALIRRQLELCRLAPAGDVQPCSRLRSRSADPERRSRQRGPDAQHAASRF